MKPKPRPFVIPDLPDRIEVTKCQLPGAFNPGTHCIQDIRDKIRAAEIRAYGVVINTFEELEQRYVDEFRKLKDGRVWCIGPLCLWNTDNLDKAQRGNKTSFDKEDIIKAGEGQAPIEDWISKNRFEKRTKERGLLIRGWAPQVLILSHPAIGGFLTHCGWNSTLEGIAASVPMITWPLFSEQFLNERFLVHVLKTGVSVGSQGVMHLGEEVVPEVQVNKEEVTKSERPNIYANS
ncbi:hypothetical protein KY285_028082 [Solanum tuberosum]|nr:hypothetical protein KY285_028082 [Solanum tuberosum]